MFLTKGPTLTLNTRRCAIVATGSALLVCCAENHHFDRLLAQHSWPLRLQRGLCADTMGASTMEIENAGPIYKKMAVLSMNGKTLCDAQLAAIHATDPR